MKIKFNKFERVAGLFVLTAITGAIVIAVSVAVKRGWFETRVNYVTNFESADGVHPGTLVQIAGLRAGSVEEIELQADSSVKVKFSILAKFQKRVKEDSQARLVRPFIIGDRVLEITVGSEFSEMLPPDSELASVNTTDIMTLLSGRSLSPMMDSIQGLAANMKLIVEAFLDPERSKTFIRTFDQIEPLVVNLNRMSEEMIEMSGQMTHNKELGKVMKNLAVTTRELNTILPEFSKDAPLLASNVSQLVTNLSVLTDEFKVLIPALAEVAPDLPYSSRRAVEALDEAVVLLKAMQRSFFISGSVDDVRAEEAKEGRRMPSHVNPPQ